MESDFLIPIGKRISEIRRTNKVTQEKLADMLNVSPKHISHTERGASTLSLKNLIEFCNIFDCSLDYIILGKTKDKTLSKLPGEIIDILDHGTNSQQKKLIKYLELFVELTHSND